MRWRITKDRVFDSESDEQSAEGVEGPGCLAWKQGMPYQFRMLDDDHNLCYEGTCSHESFDPLDDFGGPNAGCVRIDYYNSKTHKWETL